MVPSVPAETLPLTVRLPLMFKIDPGGSEMLVIRVNFVESMMITPNKNVRKGRKVEKGWRDLHQWWVAESKIHSRKRGNQHFGGLGSLIRSVMDWLKAMARKEIEWGKGAASELGKE